MAHARDLEQSRTGNRCGGGPAGGRRHEGILETVHDQRWYVQRLQRARTIA
jgi:hypothetical protein